MLLCTNDYESASWMIHLHHDERKLEMLPVPVQLQSKPFVWEMEQYDPTGVRARQHQMIDLMLSESTREV